MITHLSGRGLVKLVVGLLLGYLLTLTVIGAPAAQADHNFWANCNTNTDYGLATWSRSEARSYAYVGRYEGYHWGGGCWNNNDIDDQPGDPVQTSGTHGEGGDCSGFTFKSWGLKITYGQTGFHYWPRLRNVHGPYTAADFKGGAGGAAWTLSKSSAIYMDAFASSSHIGMIYTTTSTANTDNIIEAKSEAAGTGVWSRTYRGDSSYGGVRRKGSCIWEGTCN